MDIEDDVDEALPVVPLGDKKLRACMVTGLVKTEEQFLREGNDNVSCLNMVGDRDMVLECTSAQFDGMVAVMKPSWSMRTSMATALTARCPTAWAPTWSCATASGRRACGWARG